MGDYAESGCNFMGLKSGASNVPVSLLSATACDAGGAVNSGVCNEMKPCVRICNEVVQKCPVTLGFTCPDDNRDYAESGCNFMGLKSGASNVPVSLLSAAAMA